MALIISSDLGESPEPEERRAQRVIALRAEVDRLERDVAGLRSRSETSRGDRALELQSPFATRSTMLATRLADDLLSTGRAEIALALDHARRRADARVSSARDSARRDLAAARLEVARVLEARATLATGDEVASVAEPPGPEVAGRVGAPAIALSAPISQGHAGPSVADASMPTAAAEPWSASPGAEGSGLAGPDGPARGALAQATEAMRDADPATVYLAGLLAAADGKPGRRRWRPFDSLLPLMLAVVALAIILLVIG